MRRLFSILLVASLPASSWWDEGHQVIARIAVRHLSPSARAQVADLLEVPNNPQSLADAMAKASIWADQVKTSGLTENWHFLNLAWQDSRQNIAERCSGDDCVVSRLSFFAQQLKANNTGEDVKFDDGDALRFVIHLVGDIHQPLHVASDADQGGNCEQLADFVDQAQTIHGIWDGPLISRMNPDDTTLAADLNAEIDSTGESEQADLAGGNIDDWAWESHRLAMLNVYRRLGIPKADVAFPASCAEAPEEIRELRVVIDDAYLDDMQPVVREQLKKAGLRLAKMLNDILG